MLDIIRKLCQEKGITVTQLEAEIGISKNSIYRWQANKPSIDKVQKVAAYFGVTTSELLGEKPQKFALFEDVGGFASLDTKKDPAQSAEPKTNEFINLYASLNPEQQAKVEAFAKFLQMEGKE